jgi:GLPGLI family protein
MKRLVFILIYFYCITVNLSAQNYVAEYQSENIKGRLTFNAVTWRYDMNNSVEVSVESDDIDLDEKPAPTDDSVSTFYFRSLDTYEYLDEELILPVVKYVIKGELIPPEWQIVNDSIQTIGDYTCLMAKGFICGRNFTAWFTPDIPVSAGPWKLWGLPGLIVSAHSDDGFVDIDLTSLKKTNHPPVEPIVEKTIRPEEYKKLFQEKIQKLTRTLRALSEGRTEIDVSSVDIRHPDKSLFE